MAKSTVDRLRRLVDEGKEVKVVKDGKVAEKSDPEKGTTLKKERWA